MVVLNIRAANTQHHHNHVDWKNIKTLVKYYMQQPWATVSCRYAHLSLQKCFTKIDRKMLLNNIFHKINNQQMIVI